MIKKRDELRREFLRLGRNENECEDQSDDEHESGLSMRGHGVPVRRVEEM